ncbi:MAG: hypothetical protein CMO55_24085 [Verrucomicrobiales bacterium]|nr:hypothetical protein [Verrucomicrobiales bacterium]
MNEPEQKPKNTPLQAGSGCVGVGVAALFLTLCFAAIGAISGKSNPWIPLTAVGIASTAIGLIAGIPLVRRGREVNRLLQGDGEIASWHYTEYDEEKKPSQVPVVIGEKGIYVDGNYIYWSPKCKLVGLDWDDGVERKMILTYARIGPRNQGAHVGKQTMILPVPHDQIEEAEKGESYLRTLLPRED